MDRYRYRLLKREEHTLLLRDDGYRIDFLKFHPAQLGEVVDWKLWAEYKQCDVPALGALVADALMADPSLQERYERVCKQLVDLQRDLGLALTEATNASKRFAELRVTADVAQREIRDLWAHIYAERERYYLLGRERDAALADADRLGAESLSVTGGRREARALAREILDFYEGSGLRPDWEARHPWLREEVGLG